MGAWGTGILQNDTTADVWQQFQDEFNKGLTLKQIRKKLEEEYALQDDEESYGEVWTGIAYGQWMCGQLESYTLRKVKSATNKKWLNLWADNKKLLPKRIKAINEFVEKIQKPRSKPLKRKSTIEHRILLERGDIIGIKVNATDFLLAIVVDEVRYEMIISNLLFQGMPSQKEILNAEVLYLDIGGAHYYHRGFFRALFPDVVKPKHLPELLKITNAKQKEYLSLGATIPYGNWNKIAELYNEQTAFLNNQKSDKPFPIKIVDILKPKKELQNKIYDWSRKMFRETMERSKIGIK